MPPGLRGREPFGQSQDEKFFLVAAVTWGGDRPAIDTAPSVARTSLLLKRGCLSEIDITQIRPAGNRLPGFAVKRVNIQLTLVA